MQALATTPEPSNSHEVIKKLNADNYKLLNLSDLLKAVIALAFENQNDQIASALNPIATDLYDTAIDIQDMLDKLGSEQKR